LRIHRPEALDDLEPAVTCLADVHAHPHVVLAGHHDRGPAGPLGDLRAIQGGLQLRAARQDRTAP
jgi:hypothetical protein